MSPREYARAWERRARDYGPAMDREFRAVGALAHEVANRLLTAEIYAKPEDVRPSGKPKWRRTNFLAHSEQPPRFEETDSETLCILENTAPYSEPRHEANKPGRRQINAARTAHWRDDMLTILDQEAGPRLARRQIAVLRET